jgi:hypothetical protein
MRLQTSAAVKNAGFSCGGTELRCFFLDMGNASRLIREVRFPKGETLRTLDCGRPLSLGYFTSSDPLPVAMLPLLSFAVLVTGGCGMRPCGGFRTLGHGIATRSSSPSSPALRNCVR